MGAKQDASLETSIGILLFAVGTQLDSSLGAVDPRFGRAKYFILYDTADTRTQVKDNDINLNAVQGAGIQAAKNVVDTGAEALITGNVGPKAFAVLGKAGITVYPGVSGSVADAITAFEAGTLKPASSANVEGHWS